MKEVVLDTETTGISIKDGHRLVEIGAIELDNLIPTKNYFHCYLNPERKVSEKAFEVHGYSDEFLSKQQSFKEVSEEFLAFIENKKIVILDIPLLLENKINKKEDILVYVQSKKLSILKNLKKRKNYNLKLLKRFKEAQLPTSYKKKKSNFIIKNDFTKRSVNDGIKKILKEIE